MTIEAPNVLPSEIADLSLLHDVQGELDVRLKAITGDPAFLIMTLVAHIIGKNMKTFPSDWMWDDLKESVAMYQKANI